LQDDIKPPPNVKTYGRKRYCLTGYSNSRSKRSLRWLRYRLLDVRLCTPALPLPRRLAIIMDLELELQRIEPVFEEGMEITETARGLGNGTWFRRCRRAGI